MIHCIDLCNPHSQLTGRIGSGPAPVEQYDPEESELQHNDLADAPSDGDFGRSTIFNPPSFVAQMVVGLDLVHHLVDRSDY